MNLAVGAVRGDGEMLLFKRLLFFSVVPRTIVAHLGLSVVLF